MKILFSLLTVLSLSACVSMPSATVTNITLEEVLMELQKAVDAIAMDSTVTPLPDLKEATVSLLTKTETSADGKVKVVIVSGALSHKLVNSNSLELKLRPRKRSAELAPIDGNRIAKQILASAAATGLVRSLELSELTVTSSFEVTRKREGGLSFEFDAYGATVGPEASFSGTRVSGNTLTLKFADPE
ncbi:hypothetical protein [Thiocapsa bogorovii]|uniref:hypothetical protein n=1 Tax=Thiocapsa bogorovii TaxID=521689 RepID=UPI001E570FD4|nr:hypothetical protein [Thiocapsa bogorovii]UHD16357.1 hypothetical protein LT988_24470 [Thiocapsa bogorovii]